MNQRTTSILIVITVFTSCWICGAVGYYFGSSKAHKASLTYEKTIKAELLECQDSAHFKEGDPGVNSYPFIIDMKEYKAWMRTGPTHSYWQDNQGNWGIIRNNPRFPWLEKKK